MGIRTGVRRMGLVESKRPVVLIVEDEFLLRMDAVDIIAAAGFEVVEAENADQAIEILEARRDITVVFTDIQMPGSMDGLKLARAVRGRWPPIKIIATSGRLHFSEADLLKRGLGPRNFLAFSSQRVARMRARSQAPWMPVRVKKTRQTPIYSSVLIQ